jgi:hypothetical protein
MSSSPTASSICCGLCSSTGHDWKHCPSLEALGAPLNEAPPRVSTFTLPLERRALPPGISIESTPAALIIENLLKLGHSRVDWGLDLQMFAFQIAQVSHLPVDVSSIRIGSTGVTAVIHTRPGEFFDKTFTKVETLRQAWISTLAARGYNTLAATGNVTRYEMHVDYKGHFGYEDNSGSGPRPYKSLYPRLRQPGQSSPRPAYESIYPPVDHLKQQGPTAAKAQGRAYAASDCICGVSYSPMPKL